jgi:hypothetical protein
MSRNEYCAHVKYNLPKRSLSIFIEGGISVLLFFLQWHKWNVSGENVMFTGSDLIMHLKFQLLTS